MNKEQALKELDLLKLDFEKRTKELERVLNSSTKDWHSVVDFESTCIFNGYKAERAEYLINKWKNADLTESQIAGLKLEYCIKAINEGWKPDWSNKNQYKYYNWFEKKSSGWVFHGSNDSSVHSRLGFGFFYENKEKANFGAKQFKQYYDIWLG